jgi:hypothetical protein
MIHTVADSVKQAQLKVEFAQDSADALVQMNLDGKGHELGSVREYFDMLEVYRKVGGLKPTRLRPTKIA